MAVKVIDFEIGKTYKAHLSNCIEDQKIKIVNIYESIFEGRKLIHYKFFIKSRKCWYEEVKDDYGLSVAVDIAKE